MDTGDGGREIVGDAALGGDVGGWGAEMVIWGAEMVIGDGDLGGGDGDLGGGDEVCGEGGGIGITGEPARCTVSVFFC